ncbi:MAG: hypothetical protein A2Z20_03135 [Bdellovibrionales bacterium RBG_16_40_8]|nr:MAG: hypothetical protein A2Z20_03135 [Bdellovibrionales bacterium RBG_16_40_8]
MKPLIGKKILSIATNLPGPTACQKLTQWGADVTKIEPPVGDQLNHYFSDWYKELNAGQKIIQFDLKDENARELFANMLSQADLLITSQLEKSLKAMQLDWPYLNKRHPQLSVLQIFSYEDENRPGHDLNFQLNNSLVDPPHMPRTLLADLMGAERACAIALILLLSKTPPRCEKIYLNKVAKELSLPVRYGATVGDGPLSGNLANYRYYECKDGWIALCALEKRFLEILKRELSIKNLSQSSLNDFFSSKTVASALEWGIKIGVPISA